MNPMDRILQYALKSFVDRGDLRVTTPSGFTFTCGDAEGPPVAIRISTPAAVRHLLLDPEMALGECYMDGTLVIEQGSITDLLGLGLRQERERMLPFWAKPQWFVRALLQGLRDNNHRGDSRRNVAHHYDLDERLYSLFLDADQQYSCAYFETPDQTLDEAQLAKKRHIAAKLRLKRGMQVLDIGSGWGGLAMYLARHYSADVTGITLSDHQLAQATLRVENAGLAGQAKFVLQDYRDVEGHFDRIVSVGMFEHVGPGFYDAFFRKCADILDERGVMLLHSIGRSEGPNVTNPWVEKYVFPGGYIPALSEVLPAVERSGLLVTDIEILRLHYAETLKVWRERFQARKEEVQRIYDERFFRMWEFYLAASEMAFRNQALMVMQLQLTLRQDVVPMTRDYIGREEARLKAREATLPALPAYDLALDATISIPSSTEKAMR